MLLFPLRVELDEKHNHSIYLNQLIMTDMFFPQINVHVYLKS
jgi:hypothetical protein